MNNALRNVSTTFYRQYSRSILEMPKTNINPKEYKGMDVSEMSKIRREILPSSYISYYKEPLALAQGHMQWLWDTKGKRYLDLFAGICTVSVGHCHPKVTKAMKDQVETLVHCSNIYYHDKIHEYAKQLTDRMPGNLKVVYFVNSGSEATDLAILMARSHTRKHGIVSIKNCYHGVTYTSMAITGTTTYKHPVPQAPGFHHTILPDPYRGPWGGSYCRDSPVQARRSCNCNPNGSCEAADSYVKLLEQIVTASTGNGNLAAFVAESIQGVGGTMQFPKGYLKGAYNLVKKHGGLFVSDEVQTGFGRTGDHYWGFQMHEVQPDIVTMAKGIGNGFPLGAVVTTPEIASCLVGVDHFNTFGGNPLACAVGLEVLNVIDSEQMQQNCKTVGRLLLHKLKKLQDEHPDVLGDVRGKGLMIGIDLIEDEATKQPMKKDMVWDLMGRCRDYSIMLGKGGEWGNVLRIKPPMCITQDDADFTVEVLSQAIKDMKAAKK